MFKADAFEGVHHLCRDERILCAGNFQYKGEIVVDVAVFEQAEILEDNPELAAQMGDLPLFDGA